MSKWSQEIEDELSLLIKEWLKQNGRSQAELKESLSASSSRMQALLEKLKKEYSEGGMRNVAYRLCEIENSWSNTKYNSSNTQKPETSYLIGFFKKHIWEP